MPSQNILIKDEKNCIYNMMLSPDHHFKSWNLMIAVLLWSPDDSNILWLSKFKDTEYYM